MTSNIWEPWMQRTEKIVSLRIGLAWQVMTKFFDIGISRNVKIMFFRATVESILIYGAEYWALTNELSKKGTNLDMRGSIGMIAERNGSGSMVDSWFRVHPTR